MNNSPIQVTPMHVGRLWPCVAKGLDGFRAVVLLLVLCVAPVQAATPMMSAGGEHTLALKADGTVWAWGNNDDGQLGDGTTTARSTPVKISVPGGATAVAAGERYSLALGADGFVYAWGYNGQGQLGKTANGNIQANWAPAKIVVAGFSGVTAIAAGAYHAVAIKDGKVWTWGANWSNQLGRNGASHDAVPTQLNVPIGTNPATTVYAVAAGGAHSLALRSDGAVFSWGSNASGQIGGSSSIDMITQVSGGVLGTTFLTDATAVSAGRDHSVAILSSTTAGIVAWGANWAGQLGNGSATQSPLPVTVNTAGVVGAVSKIQAGGAHTMLLTAAGAVWAWGYNTVNQVGDGTATNQNLPVSVAVSGTPDSISAGASHSGVVMADGTVRAWGHDGNGRRGDGERVYRDPAQRFSLINLQASATVSLALAAGSPGSVAATFNLNSSVAGAAYWVLLTDNQRAPDYAKLRSMQDGVGGAPSAFGATSIAAGQQISPGTPLVPGTAYRIFAFVEPTGVNCSISTSTASCSNVVSLDFKASAGNIDRPTAGTTPTGGVAATEPVTVTITGSTGTGTGATETTSIPGVVATTPGSLSATKVPAIEYFHAGFGHYFITAFPGEASLLDAGHFQGWARTGQSFNVHSNPDSSDSAVCRFFSGSRFSPKSSHFYTPSVAECEKVKLNPDWQYEPDLFYVQQPITGVCPSGKQDVYRLYNNGMSGAPNHRYVSSSTIRQQMVAQGWFDEGIAFCADN